MSLCNRLRDEQLILFAYGEEEAPEVALHLTQCPACRARLEEARMVRAVAAALAPVEPPAKLVRALRAEAARAAQKRRRRHRAAWWLIPATALAALVLLLVGLDPRGQRQPDETRLAGIAPLNLDRMETDLDRCLGGIGLAVEEPAEIEPVGEEEDGPETFFAQLGNRDEEVLSPSERYLAEDETESLDRIELALSALENDLGLGAGR
jgi:hypothetical protein